MLQLQKKKKKQSKANTSTNLPEALYINYLVYSNAHGYCDVLTNNNRNVVTGCNFTTKSANIVTC